MLELSEEPKRLTSTFLAYRNDIDIYTEDQEKDKEFYKTLFKRLISNDIKINDITPLGSCSEVIARCENEPENGRKKIFIIDRDISIIHGKEIPALKNLFVLDAYCIENFLFDKETVINFIYLNCATKPIEIIEQELTFENWLEEYTSLFIELFIHFGIADFFGLPFRLYNANKYHKKSKDSLVFDSELVRQDIDEIKIEIISAVGEVSYEQKRIEFNSKWSNCIDNLLTIVSGKDYLIPILLFKTQCFKRSNALPTLEEVKLNLAQFNNLNKLQRLKETIESL